MTLSACGPMTGDLPHVAAERQQAALVLQERHRLVQQSPRELVALAGARADLDRVLGDISRSTHHTDSSNCASESKPLSTARTSTFP
jgi:hypothetical protein